jgi:hypothetical protein
LLKKKFPGEKWDVLEEAPATRSEEIISQYPTSSKKKQNWSSIEKQVSEEEEKEQPDGDAALNKYGCFKMCCHFSHPYQAISANIF